MRSTRLAAALILLALGAAACGNPSSGSSGVTAGKKIAFLTPDGAARYDNRDRPVFTAKVQSLCSNCAVDYRNAGGDATAQVQQAAGALAAGAGVLVLDPVDASAASTIVDAAAKRNVPVVAYDRLVMNTKGLAYYVSFDNETVGSLQGKSLLSAMKTATKPTIVMINGDADDPEAKAIKKAAHAALDGKVIVATDYDTPSWNEASAQSAMTKALVALQNKVDGVYAANDEVAGGVVAALKAARVKAMPPVTGGDAELAAVQRIIAGDQLMTVYRPIRQEAELAATLAYDLVFGVSVPEAVVGGKLVNNGERDVPAVLVQPVTVTRKSLISTVIADGLWTRSQLCTAEYAQACRAAGLS
jgi:D-xylose transport system substrate-binding protein